MNLTMMSAGNNAYRLANPLRSIEIAMFFRWIIITSLALTAGCPSRPPIGPGQNSDRCTVNSDISKMSLDERYDAVWTRLDFADQELARAMTETELRVSRPASACPEKNLKAAIQCGDAVAKILDLNGAEVPDPEEQGRITRMKLHGDLLAWHARNLNCRPGDVDKRLEIVDKFIRAEVKKMRHRIPNDRFGVVTLGEAALRGRGQFLVNEDDRNKYRTLAEQTMMLLDVNIGEWTGFEIEREDRETIFVASFGAFVAVKKNQWEDVLEKCLDLSKVKKLKEFADNAVGTCTRWFEKSAVPEDVKKRWASRAQ
jgi:hypothetical protein